jgi:hypothetical protein
MSPRPRGERGRAQADLDKEDGGGDLLGHLRPGQEPLSISPGLEHLPTPTTPTTPTALPSRYRGACGPRMSPTTLSSWHARYLLDKQQASRKGRGAGQAKRAELAFETHASSVNQVAAPKATDVVVTRCTARSAPQPQTCCPLWPLTPRRRRRRRRAACPSGPAQSQRHPTVSMVFSTATNALPRHTKYLPL